MTAYRPVLFMLLVVLDAAALVFSMLGGSSWTDAGWALFMVAAFTPIKGITYRRLGVRKAYETALFATFSWQVVDLPIGLDSFWVIMGASFAVSMVIDFLALVAMAAAAEPARCLFLALYGSLVVHFLTVGFFAFQRSVAFGLPLLAVGVGLFMLPAFYADLFVRE